MFVANMVPLHLASGALGVMIGFDGPSRLYCINRDPEKAEKMPILEGRAPQMAHMMMTEDEARFTIRSIKKIMGRRKLKQYTFEQLGCQLLQVVKM